MDNGFYWAWKIWRQGPWEVVEVWTYDGAPNRGGQFVSETGSDDHNDLDDYRFSTIEPMQPPAEPPAGPDPAKGE